MMSTSSPVFAMTLTYYFNEHGDALPRVRWARTFFPLPHGHGSLLHVLSRGKVAKFQVTPAIEVCDLRESPYYAGVGVARGLCTYVRESGDYVNAVIAYVWHVRIVF